MRTARCFLIRAGFISPKIGKMMLDNQPLANGKEASETASRE
jgi:hypothetical protein